MSHGYETLRRLHHLLVNYTKVKSCNRILTQSHNLSVKLTNHRSGTLGNLSHQIFLAPIDTCYPSLAWDSNPETAVMVNLKDTKINIYHRKERERNNITL